MSDPKRLLAADPLSSGQGGRTHFAVAGQSASGAPGDVRMYQWDSGSDTLSIVGLQSDVGGSIKALAWCPHPAQRRLLALGLGTGRTQLFTLPQSSLNLTPGVSTSPVAVLSVKHQRAVTALDFSTHDPSLLAIGYERHRSDYSLLIWDIADAIAALPPDPSGETTYVRPSERLEAHVISRTDRCRHIQQYCASEAVHSVAWIPGSSFQLLASANNKAIRTYDLRAPARDAGGSGAVTQWATKAVHHLAPRPGSCTVASAEMGTVRLWDTRHPGLEVTNIDVKDSGPVTGMSWVEGRLGVGTRDAGVRLWDMVGDEPQVAGMRHVVKPRQPLQSFAFVPARRAKDIAFVVRDGTIGIGPIGSPTSVALSARSDLALSASGLQILDPEAPGGAWTPATSVPPSPTREMDTRRNRFQLPPERVSALLSAQRKSRSGWSTPASLGRAATHEEALDELAHSLAVDFDEASGMDGFARVLRHDGAFIMRRRVEEGYGLENLHLNAAIATRFPDADRIAGCWEFIDHFVRATGPSVSIRGAYDLTYQGLWAVWTGELSTEPATASWTGSMRSVSSASEKGPLAHDAEYNAAVAKINALRSDAGSVGAPGSHRLPHGSRAPQRRMMLAICGENSGYDAMKEVDRLVADSQRTKAACWAFFAGEEEPAVTLLMRSSDERHRLMAATIAGFMTQAKAERGSLFWQEHWRGLVDKVDDPYVRAVLSKIAGESWDNILYDESLPLLDRVAIAVCNLSDKELTQFLRNRQSRCVQLGSLPGLALTGFTPSGLALLQRFVDRTSDIQTAALLSVFFNRSRLSESDARRVQRWQDAYRSLLDSWLAWVARCSFDVALKDERRVLGEETQTDAQTVVTCPVCHNQIAREFNELLSIKKAHLRGTGKPPSVRTTQCLYCQNALPRCSICLLHVEPDESDSKGDGLENAYVTCQSCRHGGHASHILAWFEGGLDGEPAHEHCPVSGCECRCAEW